MTQRLIAAAALAASALPEAGAGFHETTAIAALGQPDLTSNDPNRPAGVPSASNLLLSNAADFAIAPNGRLYVADADNHRVLSYPSATAFASGAAADLVLGQPDFASNLLNNGGVSARSLALPQGLWVDAVGDLWVCDAFNHRVLRFNDPTADATPAVADLVIGQFDFNSNLQNLNGTKESPSAQSLLFPGRVVARGNDLYIADSGNSRVLHYSLPVANTPAADRVFGQFDSFATRAANNDGAGQFGCCASAENLFNPIGIAVDRGGNLYVADWNNHRVLRFDRPLETDSVADAVYGQSTLLTNFENSGGLAAGLERPVDLAFDARGNLYVADSGNNRVVRISAPLALPLRTAVYGQLDSPTTDGINHDLGPLTTDADGLFGATGVSVAATGEVLILDTENMRALRFPAPALGLVGDVDCDGLVSVSDIGPFVLGVTNAPAYAAAFPTCPITSADTNSDDRVTVADISGFVSLLLR